MSDQTFHVSNRKLFRLMNSTALMSHRLLVSIFESLCDVSVFYLSDRCLPFDLWILLTPSDLSSRLFPTLL